MTRPSERERPGAGNAEPIENTLEKVRDEYGKSGSSAMVTKFPLLWKARRARAAHRKAEMIRLFVGRRSLGLLVEPNLAAWALASTLGAAEAGPYKIAGRQRFVRWYGLDIGSLRHAIEQAQLGQFSEDELRQILVSIERGHAEHGPCLMSSQKCGALLQVTAAEREEFGLRTIEACDEPREARKVRQAKTRKARDAERKRAERGRVPRQIYEENSLTSVKPWETENISRRTWERRRARVACVSTHVPSLMDVQTHLRQEVRPSLVPTVAGPARTTGGKRSLGADGHSASGRVIDLAANRNDVTTTSRVEDWLDGCDLSPSAEIPGPGELPAVPLVGRVAHVVALAERACEIEFGDPAVRATLGMFGLGLRIAAEISEAHATQQAEIVTVQFGALLRPHANDNRVAAIIRRLAA